MLKMFLRLLPVAKTSKSQSGSATIQLQLKAKALLIENQKSFNITKTGR
jgi:hypothetical protein